MRSTGSVLLAAYARWRWPATAADQKIEAPALHAMKACNGRVYCCDQTKLKQSIGYLLAKSIIGFKFEHQLIEARLTSLVYILQSSE